ncbi:MAG TPA: hypothetical protein VFF50_02300 [Candidatus Deferrimicrobiaceae bacterium]|jgi:hypothetical protein|nr:hypothetical protein [Candidatus Deferrimicrobiaceae bacterium]
MDSPSKPCAFVLLIAALLIPFAYAQESPAPSGSSSSVQHPRKSLPAANAHLDSGTVSNGTYRNPSFGFSCKVPEGWVLRTEEMNEREDESNQNSDKTSQVLLAAFSRPPAARGEDVNSSILIAAESTGEYPGLKEAGQYFGPVTEIAKAQGFAVAEEPYEFAIGTKTLVRGDFQKDVGSRVMRQSTLVILARGYAVSFTFIGGTEDEVEELIARLSFGAGVKPHQR